MLNIRYILEWIKLLFFLVPDEKRLLNFVPQKYRKNANELLKQFNLRGNELTYDSLGVIFIDGVSIPNSDIFVLFPYLFKAKRPKTLVGFDDFLKKIDDMGLIDLVFKKQVNFYVQNSKERKKKEISLKIKDNHKNDDKGDVNWWFLD